MNTRSDNRQVVECADGCDVTLVDADAVRDAKAALPATACLKVMADIFSALADPTRLKILSALAERDLCVCDLAEVSGVSQSAVSHQLRLLRDRDLVVFSRDGRRAVYTLSDAHVATLLEQGREHAGERA
ncbi:MAG: winged helix-turn-helix transcriptional regulator [Clostridiales bacterium]|nr:winged helix-turn-helix transcriptional regulator [Clostridiales bacterium]